MKKLIQLIASIFIVISMTACSSNQVTNNTSTKTTETKQLLDLSGKWIQEIKKDEGYVAAEIRKDGQIGVFINLKNDEIPWTYWVGTYDAPKDSKDEYKWTSKNTYTGNGLMASNDKEKEFTYKDGKISFSYTIQGKTVTINLVRGDWETKNIPSDAFSSSQDTKHTSENKQATESTQNDFQPLEIRDYGWYLSNGKYLYYYVKIYNPNKNVAVRYPSFKLQARSSDGSLLGMNDQTLSIIYPEQEFIYGSQAFSVDDVPASVEFTMMDVKDRNRVNIKLLGSYEPLQVINTAVRSDKILGEVYNPNSDTYISAMVVAICRDENGNFVKVGTDFISDVQAKSNTAFSMYAYDTSSFYSVEYYAYQW